jgi:hypothetical protein
MIARTFAARFAWVRTTPFGREVEPLVNCRKQVSSSEIFAGRRSSRDERIPSTATTFSSAGACAWIVPSTLLISPLVTRIFAPLRSTMWSVFSR